MWNRYLKLSLVGLSLVTSTTALAEAFPTAPLLELTPGILCSQPDSYRYPEHIAYCERDVNADTKWKVIQLYMNQLPHFVINDKNRSQFKIDHYIPLCMGGSNEIQNLWPQHMSIYKHTDILELEICKELEDATITQAVAVAKLKFAKNHLEEIKAILPEHRMKYISDNYNK